MIVRVASPPLHTELTLTPSRSRRRRLYGGHLCRSAGGRQRDWVPVPPPEPAGSEAAASAAGRPHLHMSGAPPRPPGWSCNDCRGGGWHPSGSPRASHPPGNPVGEAPGTTRRLRHTPLQSLPAHRGPSRGGTAGGASYPAPISPRRGAALCTSRRTQRG